MICERFEVPRLAHYSYLLGSNGQAVVIDPERNVETYLTTVDAKDLNIAYVLETPLRSGSASSDMSRNVKPPSPIFFTCVRNKLLALLSFWPYAQSLGLSALWQLLRAAFSLASERRPRRRIPLGTSPRLWRARRNHLHADRDTVLSRYRRDRRDTVLDLSYRSLLAYPQVRGTVSIFALVALVLSFAGAPFSHLHTQGLDHSQASGPTHQHLRSHVFSSTGNEITSRTADDDAVDVAWNVVPPAGSPLVFDAEIHDTLQIPAPSVSSRVTSESRLHLNDPPAVSARQTRAPPSA